MLTYRGYSQYILKPLNGSIWEQNKLGIFSFSGKNRIVNPVHIYFIFI